MKITPVCYLPNRQIVNSSKNYSAAKIMAAPNSPENCGDEICFKSGMQVGGLFGGILGTAAGIGIGALITAATGGMAAPFLGALTGSAVGSIGGDMVSSSNDGEEDNSLFDDSYYEVRSWP